MSKPLPHDLFGKYELFDAIKKNNYEIINDLINNGTNINQQTLKKWTPLHYAIYKYKGSKKAMDIIKLLLQKGANVNTKNEDGDTPLHFAIYFHLTEIIKLLLNYGIDIYCKNNMKLNSLKIASNSGDILNLLQTKSEQSKDDQHPFYEPKIFRRSYDE